ncbi:hypothetical protein [Paenibacillus baekrokdamisoli]|uniref:hypothetical protein n=1 Tax=Paenibacillus baekrokdamisoli TaxID=1712516 RepID=UPI001C847D0F|nr:hypothetical protein [Paenibacillus baekrokdamisoli]
MLIVISNLFHVRVVFSCPSGEQKAAIHAGSLVLDVYSAIVSRKLYVFNNRDQFNYRKMQEIKQGPSNKCVESFRYMHAE